MQVFCSSITMSWMKTLKLKISTLFFVSWTDLYLLSDEFLGAGAYASVRTCTCIATGKQQAVKVGLWLKNKR